MCFNDHIKCFVSGQRVRGAWQEAARVGKGRERIPVGGCELLGLKVRDDCGWAMGSTVGRQGGIEVGWLIGCGWQVYLVERAGRRGRE